MNTLLNFAKNQSPTQNIRNNKNHNQIDWYWNGNRMKFFPRKNYFYNWRIIFASVFELNEKNRKHTNLSYQKSECWLAVIMDSSREKKLQLNWYKVFHTGIKNECQTSNRFTSYCECFIATQNPIWQNEIHI